MSEKKDNGEQSNTGRPGGSGTHGAAEMSSPPEAASAEPPHAHEHAKEEPGKASAAPADPAADEPSPAEPVTPAPLKPAAPAPKGAAWGEPIARFEQRWTYVESRLITVVLISQLIALTAWVFLSGLSSPASSGNSAGTIFRAMAGAVVLGVGGWLGTRSKPLSLRRLAVIGGIVVGIALAPFWKTRGVEYFDNIKAWLQDGSTLTLMGGLRGLGTRLTLWLALLGASLATAAGKHIHIDVIFRFLPTRLRVPAGIANFLAAATVCFAGMWGFIDYIAIESFGAKAEDTAGAKVSSIGHHMGEHFFLMRKQIGLDLRSTPHILAGERYDRWMSAKQWNEWVKDAGFESHYKPEQVQSILVSEDADAPAHVPLVLAPDGETTRGMLVHDLTLVFPFGLFVIGLRFLIRVLLALSGHINLDPDAAHKEEARELSHEAPAAQGGA